MNACDVCGSTTNVNHRIGLDVLRCCRCHVMEGSPPADWHLVCMATHREITKRPALLEEQRRRKTASEERRQQHRGKMRALCVDGMAKLTDEECVALGLDRGRPRW